jgi:hypothetical protein
VLRAAVSTNSAAVLCGAVLLTLTLGRVAACVGIVMPQHGHLVSSISYLYLVAVCGNSYGIRVIYSCIVQHDTCQEGTRAGVGD